MHETAMRTRRHQRGYALLFLLLSMSVLMIAAATAVSSLAFTIRRDREEELIHRGVQYRRAIREFTKKTGRFPTRIEELDNTDGRRFLRKHYKDPITGQDFKLVYMSEIQLGAPPVRSSMNNSGDDTQRATDAGDNPDVTDSAKSDTQTSSQAGNNAASPAAKPAPSSQILSGGLIVGVVSKCKDQTIREFNQQKHYNEWRFYYDTAFDREYLANAPTQKLSLPATAPPVNQGQ